MSSRSSSLSFPPNFFVSTRVRPLFDPSDHCEISVDSSSNRLSTAGGIFEFDRCFGPEVETPSIASDLIPLVLPAFLSGVNVSLLAYGATGAFKGRTFLGGEPGDGGPGLIEKLSESLFQRLETTKFTGKSFLSLSAFQLFPSLALDLNAPNTKTGLNTSTVAALSDSLSEVELTSFEQFSTLFNQLNLIRQRIESRAPKAQQPHTFVQLHLQTADNDTPNLIRRSTLSFILLSGSGGVSLKFNPGLQAFNKLIEGLAANSANSSALFQSHLLTQLLFDSFGSGGLNFIFLFVDGRSKGLADSMATLELGSKMRKISQMPKQNRMINWNEEIKELREEIKVLRGKLGIANSQAQQAVHDIQPQLLKALKDKIAQLERIKAESWEAKREKSVKAMENRKQALIAEGLGFVMAENLQVPDSLTLQARNSLQRIIESRKQIDALEAERAAAEEGKGAEDLDERIHKARTQLSALEDEHRTTIAKIETLQDRQRQRKMFTTPADQARFNRFTSSELQRSMEQDAQLMAQLQSAQSPEQVEAIKTAWERDYFYSKLIEMEYLHELQLNRQQEQMWATFKNYREHFEEQRQRNETKFRDLIENSVKDALKLSEENLKLKAQLENKFKKL